VDAGAREVQDALRQDLESLVVSLEWYCPAIRSDLPGQITAQVTENVYDSPTGRILLVPQGRRLIGQYQRA